MLLEWVNRLAIVLLATAFLSGTLLQPVAVPTQSHLTMGALHHSVTALPGQDGDCSDAMMKQKPIDCPHASWCALAQAVTIPGNIVVATSLRWVSTTYLEQVSRLTGITVAPDLSPPIA